MAVRGGYQWSESLDPLTEGLDGGDLITSLQTQLRCLQNRVKELEIENARLVSQISSCQRGKIGEKLKCLAAKGDSSTGKGRKSGAAGDTVGQRSELEGNEIDRSTSENLQEGIKDIDEITKKTSGKGIPGCNGRIMHNCAKRFVALKVMYFGQRFYGFASEAQMDPTVESEIFKALEKTRLLVGDKRESRYSRCGRTDKGVSSVGQVISLLLRSNLKQIRTNATHEEITENYHCEGEIDYVRILNRVLPQDIRVLGWCAAPTDLHARFSCSSREYMYLFWRESLDIRAMGMACKKFIGEHDFRNFCKMDAVNVHNYRRHIASFEILSYNKSFEGDQIWAMTIKGSAFLWHQVRCMVAVLFMVGQGLESPSVIDVMLDTKRTPRKPQYCMAPELPLILHTCEFEGLNFVCSPDAREDLHKHLKNEFLTYKLKAAIFHEALLSCFSVANDKVPLNHGMMKRKASHIPLVERPTEPSYEERCAKLKSRMQKQESAA